MAQVKKQRHAPRNSSIERARIEYRTAWLKLCACLIARVPWHTVSVALAALGGGLTGDGSGPPST